MSSRADGKSFNSRYVNPLFNIAILLLFISLVNANVYILMASVSSPDPLKQSPLAMYPIAVLGCILIARSKFHWDLSNY